jgi:hypothetical protein
MKVIKIMPEFGVSSLWLYNQEGIFENIEHDYLDLSELLIQEIKSWTEKFNLTLNQDYPPISGFLNEKEEIEFEKKGVFIWEKLIYEKGEEFNIFYYSILKHKLFETVDDYNNSDPDSGL